MAIFWNSGVFCRILVVLGRNWGSKKKRLVIISSLPPMVINEKRSKTTRSRFPASISLPDKTVELQRSRGELRRERLSHLEKGCCVRRRKKYPVTYRCVWVSLFDVPSTPVCLQKRSLRHQAVIHTVCLTSRMSRIKKSRTYKLSNSNARIDRICPVVAFGGNL